MKCIAYYLHKFEFFISVYQNVQEMLALTEQYSFNYSSTKSVFFHVTSVRT